MDSGQANNVRLTTPERNRQPGFHRSGLPAWTERASFPAAENAKAQTSLSHIRSCFASLRSRDGSRRASARTRVESFVVLVLLDKEIYDCLCTGCGSVVGEKGSRGGDRLNGRESEGQPSPPKIVTLSSPVKGSATNRGTPPRRANGGHHQAAGTEK